MALERWRQSVGGRPFELLGGVCVDRCRLFLHAASDHTRHAERSDARQVGR